MLTFQMPGCMDSRFRGNDDTFAILSVFLKSPWDRIVRLTSLATVVSIAPVIQTNQPGAPDKQERIGKAVRFRCGGATVTG